MGLSQETTHTSAPTPAVAGASSGLVHRKAGHGNAARQDTVLRSGDGESAVDAGAKFDQASSGGGGEIPFRSEMEQRFGEDFSDVRVFFGKTAEMDAIGAEAAARGQVVVFAATNPDKETVAHELTHVVQARRGGGSPDAGGEPQKSTGVSDPGSSAEREAESVASRVASGGSSGNIGGSSDGSVHRSTNPEIDAYLDKIDKNYVYFVTMQQKAVTEVEEDAQDKPSPKLDAVLLGALAQVALSFVCGGIGGAVADKLVGTVARMANAAVKSAVSKAVETGTKTAVDGKATGDKAALRGFFRGQWDTLGQASHDAQTAFIDQRKNFHASATGLDEAKSLYNSQETVEKQVKEMQRIQTLSKWLSYMAQKDSGTSSDGGTSLTNNDTSRKGVLCIELDGGSHDEPLKISEAEMDGVGDDLAAYIQTVNLGALKPPIKIKGDTDGGFVNFGMNETNTMSNLSTFAGSTWLNQKAFPPDQVASRSSNYKEMMDMGGIAGAVILAREIWPKTLNQLGAKIVTSGGVFD